ncbi:MAG: DNA-binding protein [Deltaproteobacteria bacterium]|nr:DNA-binding protein [Deltaproteobacteria bacterium]
MAFMKPVESKALFMGRLAHGSDLLEAISEFCLQNRIRLGRIKAIGAVQKARVGFYNQKTREYQYNDIDRPLEITNLAGNVSIKDGRPMVHAHITLADEKGNCFGGHLASGTIIFACELILDVFDGPAFERGFDEATGLTLWEMGE